MKNKFSLLISASALAFMACSSLEVSNPEEGIYPEGWNVVEYMAANPDLRSLQIMDQVGIINTKSGLKADGADSAAFDVIKAEIAIKYAGFTEASLDLEDKAKMKYLGAFNINGATNELVVLDTLTLDTGAIARQYVVYGKREGRPYRLCRDTETALFEKGDCYANAVTQYYDEHLFCSRGGVTYCIDCDQSCGVSTPAPVPSEETSAEDPAVGE